MDDNSMPPNNGGQNSVANKKSSNKRANNPQKKIVPANINKGTQAESSLTATGLLILVIEALALVFWQMADSLHGYACGIFHSLSLCCFVAGPTIFVNRAVKRSGMVWSLFALVCAVITFVEIASNRPSPPDTTAADNAAKMEKLQQYFSNQWQQSTLQLSDAQKELAEVKAATMPRRITPEQREKFIKILLEHNNVSKIPIKVIVGKTDSETENFATQFREMLDAAGYGANAKPAPDEAVKVDRVVVTSFEPNVEVPPFTSIGKNQEIVRIPDFFVTPAQGRYAQKNSEVICMFSSTNGQSSIPNLRLRPTPPSVMVMYPNPKIIRDPNDIHYAYHPTQNPDDILLGVSSVLIHVGIRIGNLSGKTPLKPGEVAFYIPQKIY